MIFVSHSSKDAKIVAAVCRGLEARGFRCWLSSRDIPAGENYQESIDKAIAQAQAMLLILTAHAMESSEILKELSLASTYGIPVIPARAEDVTPTGAFRYELATRQWVDLFGEFDPALDSVAEQIGKPDDTSAARVTRPTGLAKPSVLAWLVGTGGVLTIGILILLATIVPLHQKHLALRSTPAKLTHLQIVAMLTRDDFYDARINAIGHGAPHLYEHIVIGDEVVVVDHATGLMWQKSGSRDAMTLDTAAVYIKNINAKSFAGYTGWRLPTLEEAMSLMEPKPVNDYHISPEFEIGMRENFIWTADHMKNGEDGFVVYFSDGYVAGEKHEFNAWVRAVRTMLP
jgi:hypothetical protein